MDTRSNYVFLFFPCERNERLVKAIGFRSVGRCGLLLIGGFQTMRELHSFSFRFFDVGAGEGMAFQFPADEMIIEIDGFKTTFDLAGARPTERDAGIEGTRESKKLK